MERRSLARAGTRHLDPHSLSEEETRAPCPVRTAQIPSETPGVRGYCGRRCSSSMKGGGLPFGLEDQRARVRDGDTGVDAAFAQQREPAGVVLTTRQENNVVCDVNEFVRQFEGALFEDRV